MGVFEQFPYTNFHELNLDWVLQKLKAWENELAALEALMSQYVKNDDITNNRKLSPSGNFTGTINGVPAKKITDWLPKLEYSENITNERKLSPVGDFTGTIRGRTTLQVLSDISDSLSLSHTLINLVNDRESIGTIYDGGYFLETEPPIISIEGGLF